MDDLISRQAAIGAAIDAADDWDGGYNLSRADMIEKAINNLPSVQPEQIARDIATIIENEKDMRVILQNTERTETHACDLIDREAAVYAIQGRKRG